MLIYTIMPLNTDHIDEICEDILSQQQNGVSTCALFSMTLVPEGNPVVDKVGPLCEKYALFKKKLSSMGVGSGVLVQATIGHHGRIFGERAPFQPYIGFPDGKAISVFCPYDKGFRDYIKKAFVTIAKQHPDCIMLDDDFRMLSRKGGGCGCPLHMKKFNEYAGTSFTRQELWDCIQKDMPLSREYTDIMIRTQRESLIETAVMMREGIDSVDPSIPGSFCCVGNNAENACEIAKIMAGKSNPVIIRINNGRYWKSDMREFTNVFFRAAQQIAKIRDKAEVILAETDTLPQNRYGVSASSLHAHFTGTILEGATGAKQWITRMGGAYEPESGLAYRCILGKYRGFYDTLERLVPELKWKGIRIPVTSKAHFDFKCDPFGEPNKWGICLFERLGLPMYFSDATGGVACLEGNQDKDFTDSQILEMLRGGVFLTADAAKRLENRGFGEYLGVTVRPWHGKIPIRECLYLNGNYVAVQERTQELVPLCKETVVDSGVYNTVDGDHYTYLFPGTTKFKNDLGGIVWVFSGTLSSQSPAFLNYSRKQQLIRALSDMGQMEVYYPGDLEVYFRAADTKDGKLLCSVLSLSHDPIEDLTLVCKRKVVSVQQLMPEGSWSEVSFLLEGDLLRTQVEGRTMMPVILKIF